MKDVKAGIVSKIQKDEYLSRLLPVLKKNARQTYLVGGYLRDALLLSTPSKDYDLVAVKEDSKIIAEEIAKELDGTIVELDAENKIYRVVFEGKYFDVTCAEDVLEDAKRRDFTLNSVYYDFNKSEIYDPMDGFKDLKDGVLKTYSPENFEDDPLRMLRAFRFVSVYGFEIAPEILKYIRENAQLISKPAKERLNYEIIKMFEGENIVMTLKLAHHTGFLAALFPFVKDIEKIPPNSHHHLNLLEHSIETVRNIKINDPLLRIAAFMHDIGKPKLHKIEPCEVLDPQGNLITERHRFIGHEEEGAKLAKPILEDLKFSKKQIEFITKMIANHIYPSALMQQQDKSEKSLIRFARKISPHTKELLALARADRLSARGVLVLDEVVGRNLKNLAELDEFCDKIQSKLETLPKLLDGNEIMELLNIKPSKRLGEIITELEEAQLQGIVSTKDEAKTFVLSL